MGNRLTALSTGLAIAIAAPAVAAAASTPTAHAARTKATVFTANLTPRGADARDYSNARGHARLVARGHRATITLTVRGLPARKRFRWALTARRCTGPRLTHFTYTRVKTNAKGSGTAKGHGRHFKVRDKRRRYVVVYEPGRHNRALLCGRLKRR
jgi:hypothetical protein